MTGQAGSGTNTGAGATDPDFSVISGNPTPEELAAVTAVLSAAIEEATTMDKHTETSGPSAWQLAQRPIRAQLNRGTGAWRNFSG